jgi:hypothetical protein
MLLFVHAGIFETSFLEVISSQKFCNPYSLYEWEVQLILCWTVIVMCRGAPRLGDLGGVSAFFLFSLLDFFFFFY